MIQLKNLSRTYKPKKGEPVKALDNVSLSIGETGMVFVLGKSGSGKSTLLNIIGGLDKYDEGDLIIQGKSTQSFKQSDFDSYRNTMIGFIFQEYNVLDEFTVAQNIGLALELQGRKATNEAISEILLAVDLEGYAKRKPNELSGGQKQRVAIARALVKDPKVIMADEPTGALDSETGKQVLETLKRLSHERLVIVVSHDRDFAETYGDRIIEFKDGRIIRDVTRSNEITQDYKQGIELHDDEVMVSKGYQLTEEDVRVINEYLLKLSNDNLKITTKQKSRQNGRKVTFTETKPLDIVMSNDEYKPIKSKLPFKVGLKIGASSLKHKRIRLAFSIILASISFALFGLADTLGTYNKYDAIVNSMFDSNINYLAFTAQKGYDFEDYAYTENILFSKDALDEINSYKDNVNFIPILGDVNNYEGSYIYSNNVGELSQGTVSRIYLPRASGFIAITSEIINGFNLTFIGPTPTIPLQDNEIIISSYAFDVFKKYGYRPLNTTQKITISIPTDLIGKSIRINNKDFIIKGIVDTHLSLDRFAPLDESYDSSISDYLLSEELSHLIHYSHHSAFFVNQNAFNSFVVERLGKYGYNSYLTIGEETPRFIENFNNRDSIVHKAMTLNGINKDNLLSNDVLVSYSMLRDLYFKEFSDAMMDSENPLYGQIIYSRMSRTELRQALIASEYTFYDEEMISDDVDNWPNDLAIAYAREYFEILAYIDFDLYDELNREFINETSKNLTPKMVKITDTTYTYSGTTQLEIITNVNVRIAGYYYESDEWVGSVSASSEVANELGYEVQGTYTSVIAPINGIDEKTIRFFAEVHYQNNDDLSFLMRNEVMATLDTVNSLFETLAQVFLYVGIGFAVFASLLLLNFIGTSVSYKKQEIGILRAIGARGRDVLSIFTKEALIIALINYVIAITLVISVTVYLNSMLRNDYNLLITILNLGIRQIVLVLLVSIGVAFISAAIPVSSIARKRPIDAIRDR